MTTQDQCNKDNKAKTNYCHIIKILKHTKNDKIKIKRPTADQLVNVILAIDKAHAALETALDWRIGLRSLWIN